MGNFINTHFSLSLFASPRSPLSRCIKSALGVLLRENLQVVWQLDDLLVVAKSPELAVDHSVVD